MAGQQLDLLIWWVPVMVRVRLVTELSFLHEGRGFLSPLILSLLHSPHPRHTPPHTAAQSLYHLLEKNSNASVIKDNELLISTGKHN